MVDKTQPRQGSKHEFKYAVVKKGEPDVELLTWITRLDYKGDSDKLIKIWTPAVKDNQELYLPKLKKEKFGAIGGN